MLGNGANWLPVRERLEIIDYTTVRPPLYSADRDGLAAKEVFIAEAFAVSTHYSTPTSYYNLISSQTVELVLGAVSLRTIRGLFPLSSIPEHGD
jgi:hypothetical protein